MSGVQRHREGPDGRGRVCEAHPSLPGLTRIPHTTGTAFSPSSMSPLYAFIKPSLRTNYCGVIEAPLQSNYIINSTSHHTHQRLGRARRTCIGTSPIYCTACIPFP
ncbi:unnamed protein product [Ectocarpus sp. 12 AP-2014]